MNKCFNLCFIFSLTLFASGVFTIGRHVDIFIYITRSKGRLRSVGINLSLWRELADRNRCLLATIMNANLTIIYMLIWYPQKIHLQRRLRDSSLPSTAAVRKLFVSRMKRTNFNHGLLFMIAYILKRVLSKLNSVFSSPLYFDPSAHIRVDDCI